MQRTFSAETCNDLFTCTEPEMKQRFEYLTGQTWDDMNIEYTLFLGSYNMPAPGSLVRKKFILAFLLQNE